MLSKLLTLNYEAETSTNYHVQSILLVVGISRGMGHPGWPLISMSIYLYVYSYR